MALKGEWNMHEESETKYINLCAQKSGENARMKLIGKYSVF